MIECPTCKSKECFAHCNNCGKEIKWLNYLGDPYTYTDKKGNKVRLPYENDDSVHRCMKKGQGKFVQKKEINEYKLDEYRTIYRYSGPRFRCGFCGAVEDLPVMKTHHTDPRFKCEDRLMAAFFKEKSKSLLDPNTHRMDEY